jgi:hypothetical protein
VTVTAGVATFTGCSVNAAGSYVLHATSLPQLTSADSAAFVISAPQPAAAMLVFTQQPGDGTAGVSWPVQPAVSVQTSAGVTVASDNSTQVSLSLVSGPGALTCTGGLTSVVAGGLAVFGGCAVSLPGVYALRATSIPTLAAAASSAFIVMGMPAFWPPPVLPPPPPSPTPPPFTPGPVAVHAGLNSMTWQGDDGDIRDQLVLFSRPVLAIFESDRETKPGTATSPPSLHS